MESETEAPLLFTLGSNPELSGQVSSRLRVAVSPVKRSHFADGEVFVKPLCPVENRVCYIIHSTYNPVGERLMELLVFIDALKRAKAKKIVAIMPYYGYARQDRIIDPGDPITGLLTANLLKEAGADGLVTIDFHSARLLAEMPFPVHNLTALPLFADRFKDELFQVKTPYEDICVVSPDHGGMIRAQSFSESFPGSTFAYAEKKRPEPNKATVEAVHGEVKGKLCLIIDDIIDTAGTLSEVVKVLFQSGAKDVWAAATHGVFSGNAEENMKKAGVHNVITSNTIEANPKIGKTVSVAPVIADFIQKDCH
jgi:ribose-phosphate pyrophosphokinase